MSIADDYVTVSNAMDRHDREGHEALQRIKARHQELLNAALRVTEMANALREDGFSEEARAIREALGPAYLGGPLL